MPSTCDLKEAIEAFRLLFDRGLREHVPNYTKPDIPNTWVNASRLAFFMSAFEGTAVMADPPRSASCVKRRPGALEGFTARISFGF